MNSTEQIRKRSGFTLLEVLIATGVTLLLMVGLAQIFKVLGDNITKGRASLELNNRIRNVIHRIRTDLENITVNPRPPISAGTGQGYLKYYDGPCTDYTFSAVNPASGVIDVSSFNPLLSRFGDVDDIFMATVKAKDAWFNGKVPRFVLEGRTGAAADANGNGITDDLSDLVTISSQFAEVIIFAEPLVTNVGNPNRNPAYLAIDPLTNFEDVFSGTSSTSDGIPDGFRLHYRVLLIRPDLNLVNGQLPNYPSGTPGNPLTRALLAGPETLAPYNPVALPTPLCDMVRIHQYCDLSIRRINDFDASTPDPVAANSLEDLVNPANRFAHVQYFLPGSTNLVTMPILALGPSIPGIHGNSPTPTLAAGTGNGFLHPAFTLMGARAGEDVLATDVLAFDIKALDPSVPILGYLGADGIAGIATSPILGSAGSDDIVLRPSDPGYFSFGVAGLSGGTAAVVSYGEFVDLDWCGKGLRAVSAPVSLASLPLPSLFSGTATKSLTPVFQAAPNVPVPLTQSPQVSLQKSGLLRFNTATALQIFQPSYDTFTDQFEYDGKYQAEILGAGTVYSLSGWVTGAEAWRVTNDAGTDGIDNEIPGDGTADDVEEKETSAPFVTNLRGIQISVRLEDRATKQFRQMSTVKQFVSQ